MSDKNYLNMSRERLKKYCQSRIKTTMIGSLEILEKYIEKCSVDKNDKTALELMAHFADARQEILDGGNRQVRLLDAEFETYAIELLRNHTTFINGRQKDGN